MFIVLCIILNVLLDSGAIRPRGLLFNIGPIYEKLVAIAWRVVGRSVRLSTSVTRQPIFGFFFQNRWEYSLGEYN